MLRFMHALAAQHLKAHAEHPLRPQAKPDVVQTKSCASLIPGRARSFSGFLPSLAALGIPGSLSDTRSSQASRQISLAKHIPAIDPERRLKAWQTRPYVELDWQMRFYLLDVKNFLELSSLLLASVALGMMNIPRSMLRTEGKFFVIANSMLAVAVTILSIGQVKLSLPCFS